MTDRLWLPRPRVSPTDLTVTEDGSVMRTVDRTHPIGKTPYSVKPKDLLLSMARMSRDGMTREQIRKELDVYYWVAPNGVRHYVDDATFDRALARARAKLEEEIALWHATGGRQGEPPETVTHVRVFEEE